MPDVSWAAGRTDHCSQIGNQFFGGLIALVAVFFQRFLDDPLELAVFSQR
jgi:hypothetical protein